MELKERRARRERPETVRKQSQVLVHKPRTEETIRMHRAHERAAKSGEGEKSRDTVWGTGGGGEKAVRENGKSRRKEGIGNGSG